MKVDKKIDEYLNESSIKSVFKYIKLDIETRKKINDLEKMLSNSDVDISKKLIEIIKDVYQDGYLKGYWE